MSDHDDRPDEIEEGTESVRRTIVGGRPLDRRRRKVRIPIGIEKVLCAAAADPLFREQLLMARGDALNGTVFEVSAAEATILKSVSEDALRTMINNIDLKRHKRRRFFRGVAAASLAAMTAVSLSDCGIGIVGSEPQQIVADEFTAAQGDTADDPLSDINVPKDIIDVDEHLADLGVTDGPPDTSDLVDVDVVFADLGITDTPKDSQEDLIDVDIQPMPAGIPPMDVTGE